MSLPYATTKAVEALKISQASLMLGIHQKTYSASDKHFAIKFKAAAKDGINYIKLTPTSDKGHAFDIEFGRIHGKYNSEYSVVAKYENVYALAVDTLIEVTTELSLSIGGYSPLEKRELYNALYNAAEVAFDDVILKNEFGERYINDLSKNEIANVCALAIKGIYANMYGLRGNALLSLSKKQDFETTVVRISTTGNIVLPQDYQQEVAYLLSAGCNALIEQIYYRAQEDDSFNSEDYLYLSDTHYAFREAAYK